MKQAKMKMMILMLKKRLNSRQPQPSKVLPSTVIFFTDTQVRVEKNCIEGHVWGASLNLDFTVFYTLCGEKGLRLQLCG